VELVEARQILWAAAPNEQTTRPKQKAAAAGQQKQSWTYLVAGDGKLSHSPRHTVRIDSVAGTKWMEWRLLGEEMRKDFGWELSDQGEEGTEMMSIACSTPRLFFSASSCRVRRNQELEEGRDGLSLKRMGTHGWIEAKVREKELYSRRPRAAGTLRPKE
jgi:hypothetical protein